VGKEAELSVLEGATRTAVGRAVGRALRAKKTKVDPEYVLRLFISGVTPRSHRAIDNLQNICERYLAGRYRIEVIDLYQSPGRAHEEQIIAVPTLLRIRPFPQRRVIGDLSQVDKVLYGLDIR
jgi:circadian clock protein KaiB